MTTEPARANVDVEGNLKICEALDQATIVYRGKVLCTDLNNAEHKFFRAARDAFPAALRELREKRKTLAEIREVVEDFQECVGGDEHILVEDGVRKLEAILKRG